MPRAERLAEALHARGLDVVEHRGWESRGSPSFSPRGVVCHHTGPGSLEGLIRMCVNGRGKPGDPGYLPGPLCHVLLAPDGACHLIAAGRANHAGTGGWRGLSGNGSVFGIEAVHPGTPAAGWPEAQLDAYVGAAAALLDVAGAGPAMCCAHREWAPGRKPDPVGIDMDFFRGRVAACLLPPAPAVPEPKEGIVPVNRPPVKLLSHPGWGDGYLVVTDDGGVFAFDAPFFGSTGDVPLNQPIIDGEVTASGRGYWLLAADGGIFAFGDAPFKGRVEYAA
jgi:Negative regulator of beta-lactamase expression